jgi:bifunctional DNA-binding transcriptional regulator/antitoxin component of YhaV-PrlF toxin-antitoxin module
VITLPAELRRRLRLDEEGARLEIVERDDGVVELRPSVVIPADQAWFWTERWQAMEREADDDIEAGSVYRANTLEQLFEILDNQD